MLRVAWGDESMRTQGLDSPVYMMSAAIITTDDDIRESLRELKPHGMRKLHWKDMREEDKRSSINLLLNTDAVHVILVCERMPTNKPERARRKCLERLLPYLEQEGINQLCLESRGRALDGKDIAYWHALRNTSRIQHIRLQHCKGGEEPMLWIPDQALGAFGDHLIDDSLFAQFIDEKVLSDIFPFD
ncbi:hypothetical protein [Bifidobacterium eulemuris]|uniref:DUF3800 domain-containing protein n=1 Tax=Bifidobacterium eulemuris TaxID=1765219 RepID=A0A261GCG1_9BIFI|nr:hypothetical protein [Bifidobacterium eulemuris]OZG69131.1 hypothetical protein BEUL_0537 [Bifidobacterium eulemuris]QOL31353.1 hypothetical protein BE0216_01920 [Bifidobacterium eulemuris]